MPRLMPPAGEVGKALERVLGSETFARSGRARDLLRYLVEREQAGEADALKGYSIALDVFRRDAEFDPSTDSVVRVQASRLRDLLQQYYAEEGSGDPLHIDIPLGGYIPDYVSVSASEIAQAAASKFDTDTDSHVPFAKAKERSDAEYSAPNEQSRAGIRARPTSVLRHIHLFWVAMAAVIALLGFVSYQVGTRLPEISGAPRTDNGVLTGSIGGYLPNVYIDASKDEGEVGHVATILSGALAGFDTVDLISRPYELPAAADKKSTEFLFLVSEVAGRDRVRIELQHAPTARSLITRDLVPGTIEDQIADLLTSVAPVSGAIYAFIANNGLETPLTSCLLQNDGYYRNPSEPQYILAFECLTVLEEQGLRSPLVYSELAALELRGITSKYNYAADFTYESAMECARKAIQLGPTSPYAHRAYGYLLLRMGNEGEATGWMQKAYELNPFDLSMAASYAYGLVFAGDYAGGAPVLERAVKSSSSHPVWWDYALFLGQFMLDDMDRAASATLALETTKRAHYLAARMIVAHAQGDAKKTDMLRAMIIDEYPVFASDPRAFFEDAKYPDDLTEKLVEAIRASGLTNDS